MKLDHDDLRRAVAQEIITASQAEQLLAMAHRHHSGVPRFDTVHVAYYVGALVVIGAMGWFMSTAWETFGGGGLLTVALLYGALFLLAGRSLWRQPGLRIPGGLLITIAVCMTPLAVYGLQRLLGWWPDGDPGNYRGFHRWVKAGWLWIELATIAAALLALRCYRFPFLVAPIAVALWYLSMDLVPLLFGDAYYLWGHRLWISLWFGVGMLLAAWLIDRRTERDYAFWLYLFGMLAFWCGLTLMDSHSELSRFFYFLLNTVLMALSLLLQRRVFIVFGALGVFGYIGYLAHSIFADSLLFPVVLTLCGIAIIYGGVQFQRHEQAITLALQRRLPRALTALAPSARSGGGTAQR